MSRAVRSRLPPRIRIVRHLPKMPRFRDDLTKLKWMQHDAETEARDPLVVNTASQLVHDLRPDDWSTQAQRIHRWVRDNIRYQHDPANLEELAPVRMVLTRRWDDCDGKARTAVAMARALGMEAKVWPMWRGPVLVHVQAAYRWPGSAHYPGADSRGWVVGDPTIAGAELGQDPRTVPRNPETGRLPLA